MATIKGCTKVGLNLLLFTVHPMKPGATLMSSFLFNVALILLSTNAAIQFCQQCFALYANETAIFQIWGGQVSLSFDLADSNHSRQIVILAAPGNACACPCGPWTPQRLYCLLSSCQTVEAFCNCQSNCITSMAAMRSSLKS